MEVKVVFSAAALLQLYEGSAIYLSWPEVEYASAHGLSVKVDSAIVWRIGG